MINTAPGDVSNMKQAIYAPKIHKGAIIGDILHNTFPHLPLFQGCQGLLLFLSNLFFKKLPSGDHNVLALSVVIKYCTPEFLPNQLVKVGMGFYINLGIGKEGLYSA